MICVWLQRRPHPLPPQRPWEMRSIWALRRHPIRRVTGRGFLQCPHTHQGLPGAPFPHDWFPGNMLPGWTQVGTQPPGIPRLSRQSHISCPGPRPSKGPEASAPRAGREGKGSPEPAGMDGEDIREGEPEGGMGGKGPASPLCAPFLSPSTPPIPRPEVAGGRMRRQQVGGVPFQAWGSSPPRFALKAEGDLRACRNQLRNPQGAPDCPSSIPQPPRPPGPAPPAHSTLHALRGWLLLD